MRIPRNDPELISTPATAPAARGATAAAPERRCIVSGAHGGRGDLIRLAIGPDGSVVPDILARAPGRGAWIGLDRAALAALPTARLKAALARAHKGAALTIADDLPQAIDDAFRRTLLAQLGLAQKAGALLLGAERIDAAARAGQVALLLHAADAGSDGQRKRDQSWRVGEEAEGTGKRGLSLPIDRGALSAALGRDNVVHLAIIEAGWAARIDGLLTRWHRYARWSTGGAATASEL